MPQSPATTAGTDAPSREEELPEPLAFTLHVVSPSVGVSSPLIFSHLPATTNVKQLKAKIRDALPSKPVDESQRLIHRGRMLGREGETMLEIFGQETVRGEQNECLDISLTACSQLANPEPQVLHLVLRPAALDGPSMHPSTTPVLGPQPPPSLPVPPTFQPRPQSTPANPIPGIVHGMNGQQPLPGFQHVQQHQMLHQAEHIHNIMTQRLQQLQRETQRLHQEMGSLEQRYRAQGATGPGLPNPPAVAVPNPLAHSQGSFRLPQMHQPYAMPPSVQNLIAQQQRERAAEGRQGAQDAGGIATPGRVSTSGRASPSLHRPDHTTTYTREGIGPNGERWHVTVNETITMPMPQPHPHHYHHHNHGHGVPNLYTNPATDIQALLRNADRFLASQAAQNNMERSASNPVPGTAGSRSQPPRSMTPNPAGPSTIMPRGVAPATIHGSPSASTILQNAIQASQAYMHPMRSVANTAANPSASSEPMVYILSSPHGPRALLMTHSETFFTPRQSSRRHRNESPNTAAEGQGQPQAVGLPEFRNRHAGHRAARRNARQQDNNPVEPVGAPHANPGAGAVAAQIGPMLWLIVRLIGFVWFFTSGNSSWTRWLMVSGLAFVVFIINTGIFNGVAEQVWGPIRRHLEALIPLAGPDAALVPAANAALPQADAAAPAGIDTPRRRRPGELDEHEVAARLIEQRRQANGGWLITQIRRAEHSLLLFLASLVPGVGERHIAAREAEATAAEAERQRRIEAAAVAENAQGAEGANVGESAEAVAATGGNAGENQENRENQPPNTEGAAAQPLIEV